MPGLGPGLWCFGSLVQADEDKVGTDPGARQGERGQKQ